MRNTWQNEMAVSSRLTTAIIFAVSLHTVIHLYCIQYLIRAPYSLDQTKPSVLGMGFFDVLMIASAVLVVWALSHATTLRRCRWKILHGISFAVLLFSTIGTLWYTTVMRQFDGYFRAEVAEWIVEIDQALLDGRRQDWERHQMRQDRELLKRLLGE